MRAPALDIAGLRLLVVDRKWRGYRKAVRAAIERCGRVRTSKKGRPQATPFFACLIANEAYTE
jgi:hypothetical protein